MFFRNWLGHAIFFLLLFAAGCWILQGLVGFFAEVPYFLKAIVGRVEAWDRWKQRDEEKWKHVRQAGVSSERS